MPPRTVQIDILTSSYRVVGELPLTNSGVIGMLSDKNNSFIELRNANMARIHMATKLVEQATQIRVVKRQIIAVCLARRDDMGVSKPGFTHIFKYPVRLTTTIYELEGTFEWPGRFDFTTMMTDGLCDFIPLYDASLGAILFPSMLIQSPVVLFNRNYVNTLVMAGETFVS